MDAVQTEKLAIRIRLTTALRSINVRCRPRRAGAACLLCVLGCSCAQHTWSRFMAAQQALRLDRSACAHGVTVLAPRRVERALGYALVVRYDTHHFEPEDFVARLAALVPPPGARLTRYHGVLAPASVLRPQSCRATEPSRHELGRPDSSAYSRSRSSPVDFAAGGFGSSRVEDASVIERILDHLGEGGESLSHWIPRIRAGGAAGRAFALSGCGFAGILGMWSFSRRLRRTCSSSSR